MKHALVSTLLLICLLSANTGHGQKLSTLDKVVQDAISSPEIIAIDDQEHREICKILSNHLTAGTLDTLVITSDLIDLDGDGASEKLIPTAQNANGVNVGYDIISQGDDGPISSGFGLEDALSVLFLNIKNVNYIWAEATPNVSSLRRFDEKIDHLWNMKTICRFHREDKS